MTIPVRKTIRGLSPYIPGKPVEELERELGIKNAIKLASNENPLGPSKKAISILAKGFFKNLHRYPEGSGRLLREALAHKHKIAPDQVILGNGSDEIMDLAAKTFLEPGDEVLIGDLTFSIYQISVTAHHGVGVVVPLKEGRYDLDGMARRLTPKTRLIFVCNPNNPTGTMVTQREIVRFLDRLPAGVIVILDEAYAEYATSPDFPDSDGLVKQGRPLIVLRTFSKVYGLAGLRIGYGISQQEIVEYLNRVRLPFNTNSLGQAAAIAALRDEAHLTKSVRLNETGKVFLMNALDELEIRYFPTQANFIYLEVRLNGRSVYESLLREGVIVRHIKENWLRVSIGRPAENRRFVRALKKVLNESRERSPSRSLS
ncbi:MAG TPA: histidinol-phosphate transaminase [Nitrospiria bacterium]|nr:histidinol-phosphate transaminase [Nitrospiria bacterium]